MPRLCRLGERGVVFVRAHAQVPLTLPSHATILTGRGPRQHGIRDNVGYGLSPAVPTVVESFRRAGYATAAFLGSYVLGKETGLARGFDTYDDRMTRAPAGAEAGNTERRAAEVVGAAAQWLQAHGREPFFVWVHLFDPHTPYEAPAPFGTGTTHPYDDEVAYADHWLGLLLEKLDGTGQRERTWIVICSDHGESLGQHGEATHGVFLYESTLHVPLVVVPPGGTSARVVEASVSLADVAPTLLEAAGLEPLQGIQGISLMPWILAREPRAMAGREIYMESLHGSRRYGWAPLRGMLDWPWKYIEAPRPELYDLVADHGETRNLYDEPRGAGLRAKLQAATGGAIETQREPIGEQDLARLESLGYVGSSAAPATGDHFADTSRPDPKDRITILLLLEEGLTALASGRDAEAEKKLTRALSTDPGNLVALNNLGILAMGRGDAKEAEALFRRGLAVDPSSEKLENDLGLALSRQGRHREAVEAYRRALDARPTFAAARFNLAIALHRLGRRAEALQQLRMVEEQDPRFPKLQVTIEQVWAELKGEGAP